MALIQGRLEASHARTQLTVLVAQLPVGLGEPLEPARDAPSAQNGSQGQQDRCANKQPFDSQQTYLSERLATVSTACHNIAGPFAPAPQIDESKAEIGAYRR
jgi:hypothetical protein